jgi:hypothetical protein
MWNFFNFFFGFQKFFPEKKNFSSKNFFFLFIRKFIKKFYFLTSKISGRFRSTGKISGLSGHFRSTGKISGHRKFFSRKSFPVCISGPPETNSGHRKRFPVDRKRFRSTGNFFFEKTPISGRRYPPWIKINYLYSS